MLNWQWEESQGIKYMTIPEWKRLGTDMLFTSRRQGESRQPFESLNLALHVGDEPDKVIRNRQKLMSIWGRQVGDLVCCEQVHGNKVAIVSEADRGRGALAYHTALTGYDGMITNTSGLYLALFYADCLPVFLFDPVKKVIALVHSGWKGTMGKIVLQAAGMMQQQYQVELNNLQAFIGPGIASCCFEIDRELSDRVRNEFHDFDSVLLQKDDRFFWDLALTNSCLLQQAGLQNENIAICKLCTKCQNELFFSYRAESGKTGRMAAVIGLQ